jgi:PAS domain S-box-containing protein
LREGSYTFQRRIRGRFGWNVLMARSEPHSQKNLLTVKRYGFAVVSVALALLPALLLQHFAFHDVELPFFLFAVALTAWHVGGGPAALSIVLSSLCFDYFFAPPLYTLMLTPEDIPAVAVLVCFAVLIARFSTVRRRIEADLVQARDRLQVEVAERTQQASLLNLTHDTIFVRDTRDIITYWNRGAEELYGWTAAEAVGKRSHDLLQTVFPESIDHIGAELVRAGRWEGELRHVKADGSAVVVSSRWSLRRDEANQPLAVLETNNDITERKRREEQIRDLNHELEKRSTALAASNKELEAFAYSVSHDLRAPLRHMVGFAELLQKNAATLFDEKSHRYMGIILDSAKRMGTLIDDLLAFSRIGRTETQKTPVNLDHLVKEALSEVEPETKGRDIVWRIDKLPDCYGDRSMLRLVLVNLLSNAVKFTRPRSQAEIEVGCANGNPDEIVVFVRDNGAGFDMKYVDKLFGVFQRLHHADAFEGTGIGLATVQRIIHRHGGKVRAEGALNQGATFYFSVPKF